MNDTHTLKHPDVPFTVSTGMQDGQLAVELTGELDLACSDLLERNDHDDDVSIRDVIVDMSHLEFIDTAGVRALVDAHDRHLARGRKVEMVKSGRLVRKVIGLYGRADLLTAG